MKNREVKYTMTYPEKRWLEGWIDGREEGYEKGYKEGIAIGASRIVELIKSGLTPDKAWRKMNEEKATLVHSPA